MLLGQSVSKAVVYLGDPSKVTSRWHIDFSSTASYCRETAYYMSPTDHRAALGLINVNCNRERRNGGGVFRPVQVGSQHPIYQHGVIAPISKLVGLPLLVYRHPSHCVGGEETEDVTLNNDIAARLMLGKDGKAATGFQERPGSITIIRRDGKPLTRPAIETIWMFNDYFLEHFQEDKRVAEQLLNRDEFNHFCEDYKEDMVLQGHSSFARMELPL